MKLALLAAALCACSAAPAATPAGSPRSDETDVRARERAWLDAYEQRDPAVMEDILTDDFVITFPNGRREHKPDVVASMRRARPPDARPTRFSTRNTVALAREGLVILVGEVVSSQESATGELREDVSTYTDTWVRAGTRWRVLASHLSRAPAPKPAPAL